MVNDSDVVSGWLIEGGLRNRGFNSTGIYRLVGEAMSVGGMLNEEGVIGGLRNLKLIYGEAFAVCSLMCSGGSDGND